MSLTKIAVTEDFLTFLLDDATDRQRSAGQSGAHHDGGAAHQRELVCAFRCGREGMVPAFWVDKIQKFERENDAEYQTYLRLKAKFGG